MGKLLRVVALAVLISPPLATVPVSTAHAKTKYCPNGGFCPPGTCAMDGSKYACNRKNCSAKNNCRPQ